MLILENNFGTLKISLVHVTLHHTSRLLIPITARSIMFYSLLALI